MSATALISEPGLATANYASGAELFADVSHYSALGHHRTGGKGDQASTAWLSERLAASGYTVSTPGFDLATFEPDRCVVRYDNAVIPGFPAWPVVPTAGTSGVLSDASVAGTLTGRIALVVLPYRPGSAFVVRGFGTTVLDAQARGAAAILVVTEGPTGEIIALNAHLERFAWRIPVIQIAGREAGRLRALAARQEMVTVESTGAVLPKVHATNVMGKRPARPGSAPGTIVLTTPKSGWFDCAGERGSGIAIFLSLASRMTRWTDRAILVVATSGHELEGLGGEKLLERYAPPPTEVFLWTHVGANIASNDVDLRDGVRRTDAIFERRGILVPTPLIPVAAAAFAGQPGYADPVDIMSDRAVGEVVIYRRDGYHRLIGLVGAHPLHHTVLDVPENVTSAAALEPVGRGLHDLVRKAL